jgi:hypothetical protein
VPSRSGGLEGCAWLRQQGRSSFETAAIRGLLRRAG